MNLQIHCDHCGKSVHQFILNGVANTAPVCVTLYDGQRDSMSFERFPFDAKVMHFCDWYCVKQWAFGRALEAEDADEAGAR